MTLTVFNTDESTYQLQHHETTIGWVEGRTIGFRGFATEADAIQAAKEAHDALREWLVRNHRGAEGTLDAHLQLRARQNPTWRWIETDDRPVARLIEVGDTATPLDTDTYGFELFLPPAVGTVAGISAAQAIYRAASLALA